MDQSNLLRTVLDAFDASGAPYILVGSVASAAYGEPRLTLDIDVVADLTRDNLPRFLSFFPSPEFYVSRDAASEAIERRRQFNVIHPDSGLKVDVIIRKTDEFDRSRFARKRNLPVFPDRPADFASPEDVIIKKLEYFREGGSEKHLRDIAGIIKVSGDDMDLSYVEMWAARKGLTDIWRTIVSRSKK
ncbi:MAG: hypothetical protein HY896_04040 [Deltaproteobacteria bacterium]|nr:hypothetical protein [Deltaproteobacteria bacterium]